ncbi:folate-binding protein YgfZ [Calidifontibacter sp. DB0510]|uniref:Folate-binding protein YgfZ n=1 Tax=Metallococcus carri TaxID=1656884 RepID=A0A967AZF1_9MICO|nr:folate-binding protein YgfZ [Metallococcus carri]NHN55508.1 folate-binding protein YgfZ [Metallococcus carri]NOP38308.1 folate-binding protein YgfZ [Calidifontibacter sp. DB2511S]
MVASSLLSTPGAVQGEGLDAGVAMHYGDPMREQRQLLAGEALVDLSHRGVVQVTGPDRLSWLHSITTQQLTGLPAWTSAESLVLSPHGHIEHALHLVDDGDDTTWITVEPTSAPALVAWLDSMRFMLRVEVRDVSEAYAVLGEPRAGETSDAEQALGAVAWVDPWPALGADTATYSEIDLHPATGRAWRELIVPRERLTEAVTGRPLAGTWAAEAERIAAWRPRNLVDTDHRTIPHELDWLRTAVHLHKGCYRGQETIARVHNLGRPPRRVVFLHLDGSGHTLPPLGAPVSVPGVERPVGRLTSVARHHEDGPIGLAVVKRNTPADVDLSIDGIAAAQTVIVTP